MQVLPSKELAPFIRHYLFLTSKKDLHNSLRLFADGSMGMVWVTSPHVLQASHRAGSLPACFLYGQITGYCDLQVQPGTSLAIAVFQPAGIHLLTGMPGGEIQNQLIAAETIFGAASGDLPEQLCSTISIPGKTSLLNNFFSGLVAKKTCAALPLVSSCLQYICSSHGWASVGQLLQYVNATERQVERKFMESVGLSPRQFSNIIRLHYFLRQLKLAAKAESFTSLAYEAGYADQSHLIKSFRKHTGITPTVYVKRSQKLAVNFIEIL